MRIDGILDDFTSETSYKPGGNEECINQEVPILAVEKLKALALGGGLGGVILAVVVVTLQTKKAMQKMRNLEVDLQKVGVRLKFMDYFRLLALARNGFDSIKPLEIEFYDAFAMQLAKQNKRVSNLLDFCTHFQNNRDEYEKLYNRLEDFDSKDQLERAINFKLSGDIGFVWDLAVSSDRHYWEDFYPLSAAKCFVDVGAYEGETSIEFMKRAPLWEEIYFFEPEKKNFEKAAAMLEAALKTPKQSVIESKTTKGLSIELQGRLNDKPRRIKGFNMGLGDNPRSLYITSKNDGSYLETSLDFALNKSKTAAITTDSLDNLITCLLYTSDAADDCWSV